MGFIKTTLIDGSSIEFSDEKLGQGGEKIVFLSRDKQNVVSFYYGSMADRTERRTRLGKIIGGFNPTTGQPHGNFWKKHFCWPTGIIDGVKLPQSFVATNQIVTPCLGGVL